jgi:hypothetical protein
MQIIKTEEIIEDGNTYVVNTYDNGTVEKYIKPDPNYQPPPMPEPPKPVTNEDIMAQLTAMQGEQVGTVVLDKAYTDGVNAV